MSHSQRVSWDQYFIRLASMVAERSTCLRRRVGAVAVKDKRILATGYNGAPAGVAHCRETGCLRMQQGIASGKSHELCRGLHAEQNVIIQAAVHGISLAGAELYCTTQPCLICMKMLINCGISTVWHAESYPDAMSEEMAAEAGVKLLALPLEPGRPDAAYPALSGMPVSAPGPANTSANVSGSGCATCGAVK